MSYAEEKVSRKRNPGILTPMEKHQKFLIAA